MKKRKYKLIKYGDEIRITDKGRARYKKLQAIGYANLKYWAEKEEFELLCIIEHETETTLSYMFSWKITELGRKLKAKPDFERGYIRILGRLEKGKFIIIKRQEKKKKKEE